MAGLLVGVEQRKYGCSLDRRGREARLRKSSRGEMRGLWSRGIFEVGSSDQWMKVGKVR